MRAQLCVSDSRLRLTAVGATTSDSWPASGSRQEKEIVSGSASGCMTAVELSDSLTARPKVKLLTVRQLAISTLAARCGARHSVLFGVIFV